MLTLASLLTHARARMIHTSAAETTSSLVPYLLSCAPFALAVTSDSAWTCSLAAASAVLGNRSSSIRKQTSAVEAARARSEGQSFQPPFPSSLFV